MQDWEHTFVILLGILLPVTGLVLAWQGHALWCRLVRSLAELRWVSAAQAEVIHVLEGDPTLVLLPSGRVVVLERPTPLPPALSSLDLHELGAGRHKDPRCPPHDCLPPPSYESIFPEPLQPPSYTDAVSDVTFHLPESAV